jgi:hypothetical protein
MIRKASLREQAPGDEQRDDDERGSDEEDVAAALHLLPERIQAHADTVPA